MSIVMGPDTNQKKVAALLVARLGKDGKTEDVAGKAESDDGDVSEAERACASDYLAAIEAKDPVALVKSLKDLLDVIEPTPLADDDGPKAPPSMFD